MPALRMLAGVALVMAVTASAAPAGPPLRCTAGIVVSDDLLFLTPGLAVLDLDVGYPTPAVAFRGSGAEVACELGPEVLGVGATPTFFDDDAGALDVRYDAAVGVPAVQFAVAVCRFDAAVEPALDAFTVSVNDARFPDGSRPEFEVDVLVADVSCAAGTTTTTAEPTTSTTTSTSTSTTTTLAGPPGCADVNADGRVTASDCLSVLRAAVFIDTCVPACVCDTDGDGATAATDALLCLREAIQPGQVLLCTCD